MLHIIYTEYTLFIVLMSFKIKNDPPYLPGLIERGFDFELMRHLAVVMKKLLKACNNDALYKKFQ